MSVFGVWLVMTFVFVWGGALRGPAGAVAGVAFALVLGVVVFVPLAAVLAI